MILAGCIAHGDLRRLTDSIPAGQEAYATVPYFNAWTVGWNAHALRHGFRDYWHAPIFFPMPGTFALSEAQPTTLIVAPLVGVHDSLALACNVYLLLLLTANAMVGRRMLLELDYPPLLTWWGGAMFLVLPFVMWQLGVLQLVAVCGPLGLAWAVLRFSRAPTWRRAAGCGLAFAFAYASCNYYGLFLSFLSPVFLILVAQQLRRPSTWGKLAVAILIAGLILSPILYAQLTWLREHGHVRALELVEQLSARPDSYLQNYIWHLHADQPPADARPDALPVFPLSLGWIAYGLALVGGIAGLVRTARRQWTLFCIALAVAAYLLSLGPAWKPWGTSPYVWLMDWYPGLDLLRSPHRLGVIVQLAGVCLAVEGIDTLSQWMTARCRQPRQSRIEVAAVCLLASLMLVETLPPRPRLFTLPDVDHNRAWIDWLKENTSPDSAVLCLPLAPGSGLDGAQLATEWMYHGQWHERSIVNGYSGFFPEHYQLVKALLARFPDESTIRLFKQWGVEYLIVRQDNRGNDINLQRIDEMLTLVFHDAQASVLIYRLP